MINELTEYIGANVSSLTMYGLTPNLFPGRRPQGAPILCAVVEEDLYAVPDSSPGVTDLVQKVFRVKIRGTDYPSARSIAEAVHTALHGKQQITLTYSGGDTYIVNILASRPYDIGDDEKHNPELMVRLELVAQDG